MFLEVYEAQYPSTSGERKRYVSEAEGIYCSESSPRYLSAHLYGEDSAGNEERGCDCGAEERQ